MSTLLFFSTALRARTPLTACVVALALVSCTVDNNDDRIDATVDDAADGTSADGATDAPDSVDPSDIEVGSDAEQDATDVVPDVEDVEDVGDVGDDTTDVEVDTDDADVDPGDVADAVDAGDTSDADTEDATDTTDATDVRPEPLPVGEPCTSSLECESSQCEQFGDVQICTIDCVTDCPSDDLVCFGGACVPNDFCDAETNIGPACPTDLCDQPCATNALCAPQDDGSFACECLPRFEGDGITCSDIDECLTDNGGCGDPTLISCLNRIGRTPTCTDIDECLTNNGGCGDPTASRCVNVNGGPPSCEDVAECATNNGGCGPAAYITCIENDRSAPDCQDINECDVDNGGCGAGVTCNNLVAAPVVCGDLNECATNNGECGDPAFVVCINQTDAPPICTDIEECLINNGGCGDVLQASCVEQVAAAPVCNDINECDFDNGGCGDPAWVRCVNQTRAPVLCEDIDVCATDNGDCGDPVYTECTDLPNAAPLCSDVLECEIDNGGCGDAVASSCVEVVGGPPECVDVNECDTDNGGCGDPLRFSCANNFRAAPTCTDVNECDTNNGGCGTAGLVTCTNNFGAEPTCTDVNECDTNNGGCGTAGLVTCTNNFDAEPTCTDVNECDTNNGRCGTAGLVTCTNNFDAEPTCTDVNECDTNNGGCGTAGLVTCTNNFDAEPTCTDVNECDTNNGGCGPADSFVCTNVFNARPECTVRVFPGTPDNTFGVSGIASSALGINTSTRNEVARDLVILPDGRIALTGAATQASGLNAMFVGLLTSVGAADTLFRANGFLTQTSPTSTGFAIAWNASASRIVAVGSAIFSGTTERPYVIDTATLSTGSTDAGFVNPGTDTASVAWGVATNAGSRTHYGIASLSSSLWSPMTSRSSGITVDTSFGFGGFFSFPPSGSSDLVRDASAVGTTMYLVGTRENGIDDNAFIATRTLDGTSSAFSQVVWDSGADNTDDGWFAVAGNASGIFAAGSTDNGTDENLLVVALNTDGSTRTAFGTAGVFTLDLGDTDRVEDIAVDGSGRLIIVGRSSQGGIDRAFVARVTTAGALDTTYGTGGVTYLFGATVESEAFAVAIDASGKAVVVGSVVSASGTDDVFVARLQ